MDREEFRRHAHRLVDWMADYLDGVENYPVRSQVRPGEIAAQIIDDPGFRVEPGSFTDTITRVDSRLTGTRLRA